MIDAFAVFSVVGVIIALGFLANALFKKTGFPDTLFLIFIGIILGPVLNVFLRHEMLLVTPFLTTLTLMMILFEGGLNMKIQSVLSQSLRAAVLAILYIIMSTTFVSLFSHFTFNLGLVEALMLGLMTAGTSSVVVIPLISKLDINEEVSVTLSIESTITDVLNIVFVLALLQMQLSGLMDFGQVAIMVVARFAVGAFMGFIVGVIWIRVLAAADNQEYTYMLTIAALILCYVGSEQLGGSGALSALLFGLVLGNYWEVYKVFSKKADLSYMTESKENLRKLQGELSFLIRAFFFVFLGLVYIPNWSGLLFALVIVAVNLLFRYASVTISTLKTRIREYRRFMTLMCGTGLANAALSVLVYNALMAQVPSQPQAYLYPLIVANIIIINNTITSMAPILLKMKKK